MAPPSLGPERFVIGWGKEMMSPPADAGPDSAAIIRLARASCRALADTGRAGFLTVGLLLIRR
jgi:hypothetical protein